MSKKLSESMDIVWAGGADGRRTDDNMAWVRYGDLIKMEAKLARLRELVEKQRAVVTSVIEELRGHVDEEDPEASLGWCLDTLATLDRPEEGQS